MKTRRSRKRINSHPSMYVSPIDTNESSSPVPEINVGLSLRDFRDERGLSVRALAEISGVSVNTLSLIENGKSSPSVSTLQKIAHALEVPMVAFFETSRSEQRIVHTRASRRGHAEFEHGVIEDLGAGLSAGMIEPFVVTLKPYANSGLEPCVHAGYEFVYCLKGRIVYLIEDQSYVLYPGDSLFFESHLPHCWQNLEAEPSMKILMLCPGEASDPSIEHHFSSENPFSPS
jgi:transcriptional regulator with XRE-family HTH domain